MPDREEFERKLTQLPLYQYAWFDTGELQFSQRVRTVCAQECPMYNTSWACPPAVGTVDECKARCLSYPEALLITTVTEVGDIADMDAELATRGGHEEVTRQVRDLLAQEDLDVFVLSTEACTLCAHCAWPDGPCRQPEKMFPCVESHGILATDLAEKLGIAFFNGNIVTWFSLLLFRQKQPE